MKKVLGILVLACLFLFPMVATADSLTIRWDAVTGATGFQVYQSTDQGVTWTNATGGAVAGTATSAVITAVPATGLVLFKVSVTTPQGTFPRPEAGVFYNGSWKPPALTGVGVQ